MAKAPDDPKRGWIHREALTYGSVDHHALEDGAVIGSKIPDGAIDLSKLTPEVREFILEGIESLQARIAALEELLTGTYSTSTNVVAYPAPVEEQPKPRRGRPRKVAPEVLPEVVPEEAQ